MSPQKTVKKLYTELYSVSANLLDNFSDENVFSTLEMRAELLEEIETVQNKLGYVKEIPTDEDTREIMSKVIDIDKLLKSRIQERMDQINGEMKGLYSKSRAAVAYTSYKK